MASRSGRRNFGQMELRQALADEAAGIVVDLRECVAKRTCLRCRQLFKSMWAGNRLCEGCVSEVGRLAYAIG